MDLVYAQGEKMGNTEEQGTGVRNREHLGLSHEQTVTWGEPNITTCLALTKSCKISKLCASPFWLYETVVHTFIVCP